MTAPLHIALVPLGMTIAPDVLGAVAAAIQMQVQFEVQPAWAPYGAPPTTVAAYQSDAAAPQGTARVYIAADAKGHAGLHVPPVPATPITPAHLAFAIVQWTVDNRWIMTVSHEITEMVVDLTGTRTFDGPSPGPRPVRVRYLAEVCDPCQSSDFAYVLVPYPRVPLCDFCLPAFYGLRPGRLTRSNAIGTPLTLAAGGSLSFCDPQDGQWYQATETLGTVSVVQITPSQTTTTGAGLTNWRGALDRSDQGYRGPVDRRLTRHELAARDPRGEADVALARTHAASTRRHLRSLGLSPA